MVTKKNTFYFYFMYNIKEMSKATLNVDNIKLKIAHFTIRSIELTSMR